ncbi:DUF924 family protein [Psychromarinibacter sp. S121]|uniref:DUF924 family protein n=1 Tax=Psychromarinibacter sp. S121 TaxID=3415127 RepID=UPI003C7DCB3A
MPQRAVDAVTPDEILSFWFPDSLADGVPEDHAAFWNSRMHGGMDAAIAETYADVTAAAARGAFDGWADTPEGRLALLLTLDQFPRSVWRDTPAAFAQDIKSCRLCLDGLANGHFEALKTPWHRLFYMIAIGHCEGPDHLQRMDLIIDITDTKIVPMSPDFGNIYDEAGNQPRRVREIIRRFGRHPHRNPVLGRPCTPEEDAYIATGDFPHERRIEPKD